MRSKKMKEYYDCNMLILGASDTASLTLKAPIGTSILKFAEKSLYEAYLVEDEFVYIPPRFARVFKCSDWLEVYDDEGLSQFIQGANIEVLRRGDWECIIRVL